MKTSKELFGKITVEYYDQQQFVLKLYVVEDSYPMHPNTYGVGVDKVSWCETDVIKSDIAHGIAVSKTESEHILKNMVEDLF